MDNRYSFLVAGDKSFLPAINAQFNSIDYIGFQGDVNFILYKDFPSDYLKVAMEAFDFNLVVHPFDEEIEQILGFNRKADYGKRYRYNVASRICDNYDAVCFLDADVFFVRNVDIFFEIASHGIMLGCAKTGKARYGGNPSYFVDGKDVLDKPIWNIMERFS